MKLAGKMNLTKGNPTNTSIPAQPTQRGCYDHEPKHPVNPFAVETKTIGLVRAPTAVYKDFVGSPSKAELLKEYVHSQSLPVSPNHAPQNSSQPFRPNKHGYFSEESNLVNSGSGLLAGSSNVINGNMSLKTSTNNVKEPLGSTKESVYFSPRADPRRRGVLDNLSTGPQPFEPQKRYARPAYVAKRNDIRHNFTNTGSATY